MAASKTLAEFFGVETVDFKLIDQEQIIQSTAHVIIDVQREFCDPKHEYRRGNRTTRKISEHISTLAPQFREAGFKTYWVYYYGYDEDKNNPEQCSGGFYKNTPKPEDELVPKDENSAFTGGGY